MPTYKICDTNVFRNIGAGSLDPQSITDSNTVLYYSPATVLELASRYTPESFEHRKATAKAVLDTGALLLPDGETYLTRDVFGFTLNQSEVDWSQAVQAMSQAGAQTELEQGVADYSALVHRRVNLTRARRYRDGVDQGFVDDMLALQALEIPGFGSWWNPEPSKRKGRVPKLEGADRATFIESVGEPDFEAKVVWGCLERALFKTNDKLPWPPTSEWVEVLGAATDRLKFYAEVYKQYLVLLLTAGMLPRANDFWDLEVMRYSSDDDHIIITADHKWKSLASSAGFPQFLSS